jgi:hypothetical protein
MPLLTELDLSDEPAEENPPNFRGRKQLVSHFSSDICTGQQNFIDA